MTVPPAGAASIADCTVAYSPTPSTLIRFGAAWAPAFSRAIRHAGSRPRFNVGVQPTSSPSTLVGLAALNAASRLVGLPSTSVPRSVIAVPPQL